MNCFIITNANKCIGCRTCEVACVVSHQETQDCASLTPKTFLPRIHVIKGLVSQPPRPAANVKMRPVPTFVLMVRLLVKAILSTFIKRVVLAVKLVLLLVLMVRWKWFHGQSYAIVGLG